MIWFHDFYSYLSSWLSCASWVKDMDLLSASRLEMANWICWRTGENAGPVDQEAKEGARGTPAARQSNCQRVASVTGAVRLGEETVRKMPPMEPQDGSNKG